MRIPLLALVIAQVLAASSNAQPFADAVRQAAAKIAGQLPANATVSLVVMNRSRIASADADAVRLSLEQSLRSAGVEPGESETKLRVTISEDPEHFLLIAQNGAAQNAPAIALVSWQKPPTAIAEFRVSIQRASVWEQRDPILDVRLLNAGSIAVAERERIAIHAKRGSEWQLQSSTPLALLRPMPRDARGFLIGPGADLQVSAPAGSGDTAGHWVPARNYFHGERGEYYSSAQIEPGTLVAGIDGRTRLFGNSAEPTVVINDWGSDIVAIASDCGAKQQVLATAASSGDAQDRLQAFEFSGAAYAPVSEPLLLAGPVTALWPGVTSDQVTVIVRNVQTGTYEASRITLACSR